MFGLTAKEKAKKQYEAEQRRKTRNSNFSCSNTDPDFLLWYAAMSGGSDSCTSSSNHSCSSSSHDSGSSYSDSSSDCVGTNDLL